MFVVLVMIVGFDLLWFVQATDRLQFVNVRARRRSASRTRWPRLHLPPHWVPTFDTHTPCVRVVTHRCC